MATTIANLKARELVKELLDSKTPLPTKITVKAATGELIEVVVTKTGRVVVGKSDGFFDTEISAGPSGLPCPRCGGSGRA